MNPAQDLYTVLGIPPGATPDDIRNTYRVASRRFHPDVNPSQGAANQFKDITAAFEVLSNPTSREQYDIKYRQNQAEDKPFYTLRVTPSKRVLPLLNEPQVLYILVELMPERGRNWQQSETHVNLTLVLDRSTSMNGARMERTRAAAF